MSNSVFAPIVLFFCLAVCLILAPEARAPNPVELENMKAGTSSWELTNPATAHEIEGYASLTSVNRGGVITFYVNTSVPD